MASHGHRLACEAGRRECSLQGEIWRLRGARCFCWRETWPWQQQRPPGRPGQGRPGKSLLWSRIWARDSSRRAPGKQQPTRPTGCTRLGGGMRSVSNSVTLLHPEHWTGSLATQALHQLCALGHLSSSRLPSPPPLPQPGPSFTPRNGAKVPGLSLLPASALQTFLHGVQIPPG